VNTIELSLPHIILKILIEKTSGLPLPAQLYFCSFLYTHYDTDFISCFTFSAVAHSEHSENKRGIKQIFVFCITKGIKLLFSAL